MIFSVTKNILIGCVVLIVLGFIPEKTDAAIDPDSIVAMWTFEEGEGEIVKDISGNGNHGTFFIHPEWELNNIHFDRNLVKPKWVKGQFGNALNFRGTVGGPGDPNDWGEPRPAGAGFVHIHDFVHVAPVKDTTITFWTKLGDNVSCDILSFDSAPELPLIIHFPWDNKVLWRHGQQRQSAGEIPNDTLGNWEFWTFIRNAAENYMRVLRNMQEVSIKEDVPADHPQIATNAGWFDNLGIGDDPWSIGGRRGSPYTGIIDELGVFRAVLSDETLTNIMKNGLEETAFAVDPPFAVDPSQKLTTTWGKIKEKE